MKQAGSFPAQKDSARPGAKSWKRYLYMLCALAISFITKLAPMGSLTPLARGYGHDFGLAMLMFFVARSQLTHRLECAVFVFIVASAQEFSQLWLWGTFDWWDFLAYAAGIAVAFTLDALTLKSQC
jgi:hypothetical protein